jgi:hypothetical protein
MPQYHQNWNFLDDCTQVIRDNRNLGMSCGGSTPSIPHLQNFHNLGVNRIDSCPFLQSKKLNKNVRNFGDAKNAFLNYFLRIKIRLVKVPLKK